MLTLLACLGLAADPAALAPDPAWVDATRDRTEALVVRAELIGATLARLQNRWAPGTRPPCTDAAAQSLAARMQVLGPAHRDAVQAARAERARLERAVRAPTVAVLLGERDREALDALYERVDGQGRRYAEGSAWHQQHVRPFVTRCAPALVPDAGLGEPSAGPTAVIGIGGGRVCPGEQPADGRVAVVPGEACYGTSGCDCAPEPVAPGAVLGPARPPE